MAPNERARKNHDIARPHEHTSLSLSLLLVGGPILFLAAQNWYLFVVLHIRSNIHLIGGVVLLLVGLVTLVQNQKRF